MNGADHKVAGDSEEKGSVISSVISGRSHRARGRKLQSL